MAQRTIQDIPQRDEFFLDEHHQINPVWLRFFQRIFGAGAWQVPTFENGWTDVGSGFPPLQYRLLIAAHALEISGTVKSGTLGATVFTLPERFRPTVVLRTFAVGTATSVGGQAPYLRVHNTGAVTIEGISGANNVVYVGGVVPLD